MTINKVDLFDGQSNSKPLISRAWIVEHLLWIQAALWPLVVASVVLYGYRSIHWSEVQVIHIVDGWCGVGEGIDRHCFGDFGMPYNRGYQNSMYAPGNIAASLTPVVAFGFEMLRGFSYNTSLALYLVLLAACLVAPFFMYSSNVSRAKRVQLAVFLA